MNGRSAQFQAIGPTQGAEFKKETFAERFVCQWQGQFSASCDQRRQVEIAGRTVREQQLDPRAGGRFGLILIIVCSRNSLQWHQCLREPPVFQQFALMIKAPLLDELRRTMRQRALHVIHADVDAEKV